MLKAMESGLIVLIVLFLYYKVAICPELLRTKGFPRMKGVIMNFCLFIYTSESLC